MVYDRWDVVLSLFPFTELPIAKARPVAVLSTAAFQRDHGMAVVVMITTAGAVRLPSDHHILDMEPTGLRQPSFVRWKIMTLAETVISSRIGTIGELDRLKMTDVLSTFLPTRIAS